MVDYDYSNPVEQPFSEKATSTDISLELKPTASSGALIDGYSVRDTNRGQSLQKTVEQIIEAGSQPFATLEDIDDLFTKYN